MGTKNKPSTFDCYSSAEPDEPMFVLLGRDKDAPMLIRAWVEQRRRRGGEDPVKLEKALKCADEVEKWRERREVKKTLDMWQAHDLPLLARD